MLNKIRIIFALILCGLFGNGSAFAFDATLVHQYTFSDLWSSSNPVKDSIGNSDGNVVGGATRIIDDNFLGLATTCSVADFNNGYILVDSLGLNTNDNMQTSVTFWLKWKGNVDDEDNRQMPMAWNTFDLLFRGSSFGFNNFDGNVDSTANNIFGTKSGSLNKNGGNDWVHITAVFSNRNTDNRNKLYINGELQTLSTLKSGFTNRNEYSVIAQTLTIGGHENGTSEYPINGSIGNFRIYDGEITQAQVTSDMNDIDDACTPLPPPFSSIVEYHFDNEHSSITNSVIDSSGNNNHGTAFSASNAEGLLCDAADFSESGISDYIVANNQALDGLTDFTAMTWVKTNQTEDMTIFSAASSTDTNEAVFYFADGDRFWPTITETPFDTNTQLTQSNSINDGEWHQVVWVREAATRQSCFYFDGALQGCVTHSGNDDSDSISVASGGLIIGQEQDAFVGDFEINQSFVGLMDEFIIFPLVLSESEISDINDNIRDEKNWDGSPRICLSQPPILDMRFDEKSWSGTNAVIDNSGNNFHGTAFGQATPVEGLSCNAVDLSATGTSDYISANYEAINGLTDFSVVFWGKQDLDRNHDMTPISGSNESASNEMLLYFSAQSEIEAHINDSRDIVSYNDDNDWHQFVWTRDASTRESCVYRDGVQLDCDDLGTDNPLRISSGGFIIGQEQDRVGGDFRSEQAWDGLIDELLIFSSVLTQDQIQLYRQYALEQRDWQGNFKSCDSVVDHYRFELPNSGLTCAASDIKITACEDEACSTSSSEISSLTLSPSGQWSGGNVTGNVVSFVNTTDDNGLGLSHPIAESVNIAASNLNPIPTSDNPIQCFVGTTSTSCELAFTDAGFIFSTTDGGVIPTQISNKPSSQEFNARTLTIQAVETSEETGACEAVFPANTDVDIELKLNCTSGTCSDINVTTGSSATSQSVGQTYNNIPFRFGDNSLATYELNYPNAGEMSFSARKIDSLSSGATLLGTSNNFVVKPFGFKFEFPNDSDPFSDGDPDSDFTVFKKAGEEFSVNAIAIGWQANQDKNDNNDVFDGGISPSANGNNNPTVQFFANESVKLTHQFQHPSGGSSGIFSASNVLLSDEIGESTASFSNANWSEVGVISLTATLNDGDYLGAGNVNGIVTDVGRFTPAYFDYSDVRPGELTGQCTNQTFVGELKADGTGALTYGGENPTMTLTAKNLDGNPTVNYRDDFARFGTVTATFDSLVHIDDSSISPPSLITLTGVNSVGTVEPKTSNSGQFIYTAPDSDHFVYTRNDKSLVAPFSANIEYDVKTLVDMDGIGLGSEASPVLSAISSATHQMLYGRITLDNAFGPETETLAMPIRHEFFNGTRFVTNTNIGDSCAQAVFPSTDFTLSPLPLGELDQDQLEESTEWRGGESALLIPPLNTTQGDIDVQLVVPIWLMFDWKGDGGDINPAATATFGRFRGNDRIINWRENR